MNRDAAEIRETTLESESRLLAGLEREKECYHAIRAHAETIREKLRDRRPLREIMAMLHEKKTLMSEIETIERSLRGEKRAVHGLARRPAAVNTAIDELSRLIEEILAIERENELLLGAAPAPGRAPGAGCGVSPAFAVTRYSNQG